MQKNIFFSSHKHGVPKLGGDGGVPDLGKIPTFSRVFFLATSLRDSLKRKHIVRQALDPEQSDMGVEGVKCMSHWKKSRNSRKSKREGLKRSLNIWNTGTSLAWLQECS